jgi:hypothetical protein
VAKADRLYTAEQGAYMTRLTMSSFRTKVSKLGIKGKRQGVKVFYSRKQLEDVHNGVPAKKPTKISRFNAK